VAFVEARHLGKRFGDRYAVRDLSFRAAPGSITAFLGPNGAGKSTTMRLMLGLANGEGVTTFDGERYHDLDNPVRRVGALLDARAFHPRRSARDHLRMLAAGAGLPATRADEVLELTGIASVAITAPKGFSLGMNQRLGLAAALLGRPDTLILDEPGNGMDPQGMRWLRAFLQRYAAAGNTVIVSSHLLAEIETLADRVVVIGSGRLIADSSLAEFVRSHNLETVRVRSDEPDRLAALIEAKGGVIADRDGDLLTVGLLTGRAVAELAAAHGCLVVELFTTTASLEDAFLKASGASVEFGAETVAS
jgi:ABC-2 type transport system ATP-binding protein